jgi:hypothetical protein
MVPAGARTTLFFPGAARRFPRRSIVQKVFPTRLSAMHKGIPLIAASDVLAGTEVAVAGAVGLSESEICGYRHSGA